jgi:antitoxin ParD1/3/4
MPINHLYPVKRFVFYQLLITLTKNRTIMEKNTSVALGDYFESFVENSISQGRYKNAGEVIRAGLRLLEEEENRMAVLKAAIKEGIDSGTATCFNPKRHLQSLKAKRLNG